LALSLTALLACFCFLPRIAEQPVVMGSFLGAAASLLLLSLAVWRHSAAIGRKLQYEYVPRKVHYVQMVMHASVYAYWGWYWREVYREIPLILGQVVFAYAFDMLLCWLRRDKWVLGFGPFPIVFSTNLFLWFRDEWFYWQFVLIAIIFLGKEFIKWRRDGRDTHIFNPSAFPLFLFAVVLLATGTSDLTWAGPISATLRYPPHIYLEIFLVGLVVQGLFEVTLVTLSAAAALCVLSLAFTGQTGVYWFVNSNIPIAVFLGLHLLITDPATSPRKIFGKIVFGSLYGAAVFGIFGLLGWMGMPQYYDKLLCVPPLNLTVRWLDRLSNRLTEYLAGLKFNPFQWTAHWTSRQTNFAFMGVWIVLFGVMASTGWVGGKHPGDQISFWEKACSDQRWRACQMLDHSLDVQCSNNTGPACLSLGTLLNDGKEVERNTRRAALAFAKACELGLPAACSNLSLLMVSDGVGVLSRPCDSGDGASCETLGNLYLHGVGVPRDAARSVTLFRKACSGGFLQGCGLLGVSYLAGQGVQVDAAMGREILEKACSSGNATSCYNDALIYRRGYGVPRDDAKALGRMRQACSIGLEVACQDVKAPTHAE
jgi:hypothetical protein